MRTVSEPPEEGEAGRGTTPANATNHLLDDSTTSATDGNNTPGHATGAPLGEHARAYARAGLPVLPLRPRTKVPATAHGKDDATCDPQAIREWWGRWPHANIGIRPPAGIVVLDVDPRNGGQATFAALEAQHGELPTTWVAITGSDGWHIWLRCPGPYRGRLGEGIDLKSHSGYLVAPPSIHPCGGIYEWANDHPIAHAPTWVRALARAPQAPATPRNTTWAATCGTDRGEGLLRSVATAPAGNRNNALHWAACRANADGILEKIRADLVAAARAAGLDDIEIRRTINSAERGTR